MLGKLLKHELRATARIMIPVFLLLLVSECLFTLTMFLADAYDLMALDIFLGILSTVFTITLAGTLVCNTALMVYRFYKNLMTDEGYLMFTLPATVDGLICSKLLSALIWSACTVLAEALALWISARGVFVREGLELLFAEDWSIIFNLFSTGQWISFILQAILALVLSTSASFLLFYAAIALGHSFANHKVLLSVVFYFAFTFGLQTLGSFLSVFGIVYLATDTPPLFLDGDPAVIVQAVLLISLVTSLVLAAAFYVVTRLLLKKRLNLA